MHRSPSAHRTRTRTGLVAVALLLAVIGGACGVETADDAALGGGSGGGGGGGQTATTLPPCDPDEGGGTGGFIGVDELDPTCEPVEQPDTPDTTDPDDGGDDTTTTEPDDGGEGGDGSPDQAYLDAMIESLQNGDADDLAFTADEAECIAPQWLDIIGADNLREAGITPEDLTGDDSVELDSVLEIDQATDMVAVMDECGLDLEGQFIDAMAAEGSVADDQVECLADALPDGFIEELLAISLADGTAGLDADPALEETLTDAFAGCVD